MERIAELLSHCGTDHANLPPTQLYNEGWLLRLVLDWFDRNRRSSHELTFFPESIWYSEALLASQFLPERRGDTRAESFTHADGLIGHFEIRPGERGEATILSNAEQFVVIEAKLGSPLSSRVTNAANFDQAARNVACVAELLKRASLVPKSLKRLAFYVTAPEQQVAAGVFQALMTKDSIKTKVHERVSQYDGAKDVWFHDAFLPTLDCMEVALITWESILKHISTQEAVPELKEFYRRCLEFNPLK